MPDHAPTMPAIVGSVARYTPEAIARALPVPEIAITSNTETMPVTVPSKPIIGHKATSVLIVNTERATDLEVSAIRRARHPFANPLRRSAC